MQLWSTYVVLTQPRPAERRTTGETFPQFEEAAAAHRPRRTWRSHWLWLLAIGLAGLLALTVHTARGAPAQPAGLADPAPVVTPALLPAQPARTPFTDPAFATRLRRLTDASTQDSFATHEYAQLQALAADNEHILLLEGGSYTVRRLDTLARLAHLDTSGWIAARWHPQHAGQIVHFDSNDDATLRVQQTDIASGETTAIFTFPPGYTHIRVNQSADALSRDGRWLAGLATHASDGAVIFALDLASGALGAQLPVAALYDGVFCVADPVWGAVEPDWIAPSPRGAYLMIQWPRDWGEGSRDHCRGLESYGLATGAYVGRAYDGHQHGDLGLAAGGGEFFMTYALAAPPPHNGSPALARYTLPGPTAGFTAPHFLLVQSWGQAGHISCQGPAGVCLVSNSSSLGDAWQAMDGELLLVYADSTIAQPHLLRLAHHRASGCGYWVQPRASLSLDGRYAVFASDWSADGTDGCSDAYPDGAGDAYLLDLDADEAPGIGQPAHHYLPLVTQTSTRIPRNVAPHSDAATAAIFAHAQFLGNDATHTIAARDLNGDDAPDLFAAHADTLHKVWLNDGTGQLRQGQRFPLEGTRHAALDDVDRDGDADIVFVTAGSRAQIYLNDSTGQFYNNEDPVETAGSALAAVALGDLNGDGGADAVLGGSGPLQVWLNTLPANPVGIFADSGQRLGTGSTARLLLADLDGDGDLDLVEGLSSASAGASRIWRNDGAGNFTPGVQPLTQSAVQAIAAGDVDGDGDLDLFFATQGSAAELWLNQSGGFVLAPASFPGVENAGAQFGDVDGDGDADLVVGGRGEQGNALWLNQGGAPLSFVRGDEQINTTGPNAAVELADLDLDGDLDLIFGNNGASTVYRNEQPAAPADLRIHFCCNRSSYLRGGQTLHSGFEFAITNQGTQPAAGIVVTFTPSENVSGSYYRLPGGTCVAAQHRCTLAQLAPGATVTGTTLHHGLTTSLANDFTAGRIEVVMAVAAAGESVIAWANQRGAEHVFYRCGFSTCLIERFYCFLVDEEVRSDERFERLWDAAPASRAGHAFAPHLPLYYALRDGVLNATAAGRALAELYAACNQEILALLLADEELTVAASAALAAWEPALAALVDERQASPAITAAMVTELDALLTALSQRGSPALQQGIAAGRALTGPLDQYTGMSIQEARGALVGFGVFLPTVSK